MNRVARADILLLIAAMLWGTTFVPQRIATEHLGVFAYNAARFALGALVLLPLAWRKRESLGGEAKVGVLTGLALFCAAALQQGGLVTTTASKAGFLTGLYVVMVPVMAAFSGHRTARWIWAGAMLALAGSWFLCVPAKGVGHIVIGDVLVFLSAFCWTAQILILNRCAPGRDPFRISFWQNLVCAGLSAITSLFMETSTQAGFTNAAGAILYAGIFSAGIAFTLQVVAQRNAHPAHAAVLMSLEAVFAALAGALVLGEVFGPRAWLGSMMMFAGMILAQLSLFPGRSHQASPHASPESDRSVGS